MTQGDVDLRAEQQASLARPPYRYSLAARFFFRAMDAVAGRRDTLPKIMLLEMLASIPYREWEARQYQRLTRGHRDPLAVRQGGEVVAWSRRAQDNEYLHLVVVGEKMKEDGVREPWYLHPAVSALAVFSYTVVAGLMSYASIRRAFEFNGEFEDHAEHVYARMVEEHPEWEGQRPSADSVREYADLATWADIFRRIGLDERDHMNVSFGLAGRPEGIAGGARSEDGRPGASEASSAGQGPKRFCTAINCMDGRVQLPVIEYLVRRFQADHVDAITEPGPNAILADRTDRAAVEAIERKLAISIEKHKSVGIAVVGHWGCAGNPAGRARQAEQTLAAVRYLEERARGVPVIGLWVGESWEVSEMGRGHR